MKQLHRFLTILLLVTGFIPSAYSVPPPTCETAGEPCSAHLPKSGPGDPICLQSSPIDDPRTKYVCASGTVTLTVTRGDQDAYGDPIACDAALPKLSWSDSAGGSAGNLWSYTFQAPATPGTYTVTCTAIDGGDEFGQAGYDEPIDITWTIDVIAINVVQGPSALCPNEVGRYTATTTPPGYESLITWTGGGHPATGTGGTFDTYWAECHSEDMQVTASYCGTSASKSVHVGADKAPPIVAGIVASRSDSAVLCANQTYGDAYDNYCGSPPINARWYVSGAYDHDTKNGASVNDGICVDLSYPGANWIDGLLVWSDPGVYNVQAVVSDQGLCCADDLTHPSAQNTTVAVVGGTIVAVGPGDEEWEKHSVYVWCPTAQYPDPNPGHRKSFRAAYGQPSGTQYHWQIVVGGDKAHIVGTAFAETVSVQPDAPSSQEGDVTLRLTYSYGGCDCSSNITLTVRRPSSVFSTYVIGDPFCSEPKPDAMYWSGSRSDYWFRDQFNRIMNRTAYWSEKILMLQGNCPSPESLDIGCDGNGYSWDYHALPLPYPINCPPLANWNNGCRVEQRLAVNGWGATACADSTTFLPPFWAFIIDRWWVDNGQAMTDFKQAITPQ